MEEPKLKLGSKVSIIGKNLEGTVAFIGATQFSSGKWIGVVLTEPQGRNDGTVQGKKYFDCEENYGLFVRSSQLALIGPDGPIPVMDVSLTSEPGTGLKPPASRMSMPVANTLNTKRVSSRSRTPTTKPTSSRQALSSKSRNASPITSSLLKSAGSKSNLTKPSVVPSLKLPSKLHQPNSSEDIVKPRAHDRTSLPSQSSTSSPNISKPSSQVESTQALKENPVPTQSKLTPPTSSIPPQTEQPKQLLAAIPVVNAMSNVPTTTAVPAHTSFSKDTLLEMENLRAEVKDLTEKLEVIKAKRSEDRTRLKEAESVKVQLAQLEENRKLMQEKSADLLRQCAQAKSETSSVQAAYDRYRDEMSDLVESVEMATLDKEMAEEKLEALTLEMELMKEKLEELSLENQILKDEQEITPAGDGGAGGPTIAQVKQLEQQNERMKAGLVTFRNIANQDKHEIATLTKEVSSLQSHVDHLSSEKTRIEGELQQAVEHTIELKEQVDAALGADQMVSLLTQRNLELEDKIEKLVEEHKDLESLCEMNDELLEAQRDTELELREQMEVAFGQVRELARQLEANKETVTDYELTLSKFRELVTDLQSQNTHLTQSLADARRSASSASLSSMLHPINTTTTDANASMDAIMMGRTSSQTDAQTIAKVIETELRRLDADQGTKHVELLTGFLPDSFNRRAGDHDAILLLLLIDRLILKCELLSTQVKKRYPLPSCIRGLTTGPLSLAALTNTQGGEKAVAGGAQPVKFVTGGDDEAEDADDFELFKSRSELFSFTSFLCLALQYWQGLLTQFKSVMSSCSIELFAKMITLYMELSSGHEQCLDHLLELCKRDQLEESVSLDGLIASVQYFVNLHAVHLVPAMQTSPATCLDASLLMTNFSKLLLIGTEALTIDASCLAVFTGQPLSSLDSENYAGDSTSNLAGLLAKLGRDSLAIRQRARCIKRRIPANADAQPLSFAPSIAASLEEATAKFFMSARCLFVATRNTGQLVATQMAEQSVVNAADVLRQCLCPAVRSILSEMPDIAAREGHSIQAGTEGSLLLSIMDSVTSIVFVSATAMEHGEYDFDGTKKVMVQEPVVLRAAAHRRAQLELESCRGKLELKEEEVRELQVARKMQTDELSEMAVRVSISEKKLESSGKGNLEKIVRLEQKLTSALNEKKRSEKEYEQAIDAMQTDIENLEKENKVLQDKLRSLSKKTIFDGIMKAPITPGSSSPGASSPTSGSASMSLASKLAIYRDNTCLLTEVDSLQEAINYLSTENIRLQGHILHTQLSKLRPLHLPNRSKRGKMQPVETEDIEKENEEEKVNPDNKLTDLIKKTNQSVNRYFEILATQRLVKLPSSPAKADKSDPSESPAAQLARQTDRLLQSKNSMEKLQDQLLSYAKSKPDQYGAVVADFTTFASNITTQKLGLSQPPGNLLARITLPGSCGKSFENSNRRLYVSPGDLQSLVSAIISR